MPFYLRIAAQNLRTCTHNVYGRKNTKPFNRFLIILIGFFETRITIDTITNDTLIIPLTGVRLNFLRSNLDVRLKKI